MGEIIDEERAGNGVCLCKTYELGGESREICWDKGIVGVLSEEQVDRYCTVKEPLPKKVDTSVLVHNIMEGEGYEG